MRDGGFDRRVGFFLVGAVLAFALTPAADPEHRWVTIATGSTYVVLAILFALDTWSRGRDHK